MKFPLEDKTILITGGTSGIGLELVKKLHANNQILVIGRNNEKLSSLADAYPGIRAFRADLSKPNSLKLPTEQISEQFPAIDLLINNAAVQYTPKFTNADFQPARIADEIAVNFTSPALLIALLLPALLKNTPSAILNVNSGLGIVPKKTSAIYCGTKGGLDIFSRSLRNQLEHTNIHVLQAFMPLVGTPMTEGRGRGKISADAAAQRAIEGVQQLNPSNDIGMVKILRFLSRIAPPFARSIMKKR